MTPEHRESQKDCRACGSKNPAIANFCQQCGQRLELICPGCKASNGATSKFCFRCGRRLVQAQSDNDSPAQTPGAAASLADHQAEPLVPAHLAKRYREGHAINLARHVGERKIVTTLFADIKSSMALLDNMDPDNASQVIDPAVDVMMNAVHQYGGYVAHALGDGIVVLFGAPIASEDHARQAIYAALSMQEQMKIYSDQLSERGLPEIQIRVGINTGEVVVRSIPTDSERADYAPIGHSVGLASRIENLAIPGLVIVSETTHRLAEGYFDFRDLGIVPMKGVSADINLFEVTGISALRTRFEVSASRGFSQFFGRDNELERMRTLFELAKTGQGQIVDVIGQAGSGKSRLCHEFKQLCKDDCLVLECKTDAHGMALPYWPLVELLKTYFGFAAGDDDQAKRAKVSEQVVAVDPELSETPPFLLSFLGVTDPKVPLNHMDPHIRRHRTFDAIQRLLLGESRRQPVVIAMEDLQWLDDESFGFLTALGHAIRDARVMLLANHRPGYQPPWDDNTSHSQLRLKALDRENAEKLLHVLLAADPALDLLKQLIIDRTQGNPFFMEEFVQTLFDEGIVERGGGIVLTKALSEIEIPATVQGVLAARIDCLKPHHKELLQMLSVLGMASPLHLVERLSRVQGVQLQDGLMRLQAAEFILERSAPSGVEYVFRHALTQEVAYGQLLNESKRNLHARAAQAIEAHYRDRLEDHFSALAHHHTCSGNIPQAVDFLQRGATHAMHRSAYNTAIGKLTLALEKLPGLTDLKTRDLHEMQLQSMLGGAYMATRGFAVPEVAQAYERSRDLCQNTPHSIDHLSVLAGLALLYINQGNLHLARDIGTQLLDLAEQNQDQMLFVSGHEILGNVLLRAGNPGECKAHMDSALRHYNVKRDGAIHGILGRDPSVTCRGFGALASWLLGYQDRAVEEAAQSLSAAHDSNPIHPFSFAWAVTSTAWVSHFRGEAARALEQAKDVVRFATKQGFPTWLAHGLVLQGWAEVELGKTDAGLEQIEKALQTYEATGAKVWLPLFLLLKAQALARATKTAEALETVAVALRLSDEMDTRWWESELNRFKGELVLVQDAKNKTQAQACFEKACSIAQKQGARSLELRACISLARLAYQQGTVTEKNAQSRLESICSWFDDTLNGRDVGQARELLKQPD